eukprot:3937848-Rhodomonas_salina.3
MDPVCAITDDFGNQCCSRPWVGRVGVNTMIEKTASLTVSMQNGRACTGRGIHSVSANAFRNAGQSVANVGRCREPSARRAAAGRARARAVAERAAAHRGGHAA